MLARDYFIAACKAECYRYKRWVIEAFSTIRGESLNDRPYPFALTRGKDGRYRFMHPETHAEDVLEYTETQPKDAPPFSFTDTLALTPKDIPNLKETITTTYGQLLVNYLCLVYPFGAKVQYLNGPIDVPRMEKIIEKRLKDNPPEGTPRNDTDLYVDELKKFNEAVGALVGFTQLCVPSATPKTMMTDPKVAKRRKELLKQYEGKLDDPVVQAKITAELIAMDREWLKGDPGERFYIKKKSYNVVRKKTFLLQGEEQGFGASQGLIETPLSEGWNIEKLPAMGSALREGSFSRGALTALGGEATKFNYRIFQNTTVVMDDCGTTLGMDITIPDVDAASYVSSSVIEKDGTVVELTPENIHNYVERPVVLRSPIYCKAPDQNFCATCIGKKIAETPTAISTYCADIGSAFLSRFLAAMHGRSLETRPLDIMESLS